jgi:alcohol dehydrogenase class IV
MATEIIFGIGASQELASIIEEHGKNKALIISDKGVENAGLLLPIQDNLKERGIDWEVFDEIEQSSSVQSVDKGVEMIRNKGFDVIIAIGGGSSIDTGKAMGLVAANGGCCRDYAGSNKAKLPPLPVIALPTTAGTSAEVTDVAVIADREINARLGLRSPYVVPKVAIVDPLLTVSVPAHVTAATGVDALSHAIESYTNTATSVPMELTALEAIRLIGENLRSAVANGNNIKAREQMSMACVLIGLAYRNTRLGILHAITGPFCGYYDISHGVANAVLLPHVMRFNMLGNYEKFAKIARALGVSGENLNARQLALSSADAVQELLTDVGLPADFKSMELNRALLPEIAEKAMKSGNLAINPRQATKEDLQSICEKVF